MYSDPQSLTISGTAVSLPRVAAGTNQGSFKSPDGNVTFSVSHTYGKRARRVFRLDQTKVTPDPLLTNVNRVIDASAYLVVNAPLQGFSPTELKGIVDALTAWAAAGTGAANNTVRLLGGES